MDPILMVGIVANILSQKEYSSAQESNVKEENFEILAAQPLDL